MRSTGVSSSGFAAVDSGTAWPSTQAKRQLRSLQSTFVLRTAVRTCLGAARRCAHGLLQLGGNSALGEAACAVNLTPSAVATRMTVSKRGFAPGCVERIKLQRNCGLRHESSPSSPSSFNARRTPRRFDQQACSRVPGDAAGGACSTMTGRLPIAKHGIEFTSG